MADRRRRAPAVARPRITGLRILMLGLMFAMAYLSLGACSSTHYPGSPQFRDGGFRNPVEPRTLGWREVPKAWWSFMFDRPAGTVPPAPLPVEALDPQRLADAADGTLFRLGHSTVLLKLAGGWWLTDPVFSERASPLQWAGPRRFHPPPITIAQLPRIRAVILSHDRYDHLDKQTVRALAEKADWFLAPLGVGELLIRWGVDPARVRQLDWWEATTIGPVRLVATPAQHFSGRRPFAGNPTLWASWVIQSPELRLFFSGDSGYCDGFREIGERYGPFDLTLLECGAYDPKWEGVHMLPEQTLQAHLDLRGRWLLPVHNGTFDLAMHRWDDPMERIVRLAKARGVDVTLPRIGQAVAVRQPPALEPWWRLPREPVPGAIDTDVVAGSAR